MPFLWKKNSVTIFGWLQLIMCGLQPFIICGNPTIAKHVKYDSVIINFVMNYIEKLTRVAEIKVVNSLPKNVALVFNR